MLHARKDYNRRIQDSENRIPADEPVFLLRGQDTHAPAILDLYAKMVAVSAEGDPDITHNTREHAAAMRLWQKQNRCKFPDMESEDSVYPK